MLFYHFDSVWFILVLNKCIVCNPQYQSLVMLPPPSPRRKQWGFLQEFAAAEAGTRVGLQQDVLNEGLGFGLSRCPPSATSPVKPWPKDAKPLSFCRWLPECAFMCPWRVRDNYCSHPRTRNSNRSMKQGWKLDPNPWSIQVRQAAPWIRCAPSGANGPRTWHEPCELQRPGVFQWWFIGFECDFHEL